MKDSEANTLRCTAHEIIIRLMDAGETNHVRLLAQHGAAAMERLEPRKPSGLDLITAERDRQINGDGWTPEHDDGHHRGEMAAAAGSYAMAAALQVKFRRGSMADIEPPSQWPWGSKWWKLSDDPVRTLAKAGALIAAEIDRLQRAAASQNAEISHDRERKTKT